MNDRAEAVLGLIGVPFEALVDGYAAAGFVDVVMTGVWFLAAFAALLGSKAVRGASERARIDLAAESERLSSGNTSPEEHKKAMADRRAVAVDCEVASVVFLGVAGLSAAIGVLAYASDALLWLWSPEAYGLARAMSDVHQLAEALN